MKGTVGFDYQLIVGGPARDDERVLGVFTKGEKLTLTRVSTDGDYPDMYEIVEHPEVGFISFQIVLHFVRHLS